MDFISIFKRLVISLSVQATDRIFRVMELVNPMLHNLDGSHNIISFSREHNMALLKLHLMSSGGLLGCDAVTST